MPALRPIVRDPLEGAQLLAEDRLRLRLREKGAPRGAQVPQRPLASNALGNALGGYRAARATTIRGGTFAPRATSGML